MKKIPSENVLSALYGLFQDGFNFIAKRRKKYHSDIFQIPLPGFKVICFGGEDAARTFYDPDKFMRKGAVPPPVQKTLTGKNAIHTTDGEVHHNRKEMFLSLMTEENIARLTQLVETELSNTLPKWTRMDAVLLFQESQQVLCKAICAWAGVPLKDNEAAKRARDFTYMIDAFGSIGSRNWRGRLARRRAEKWIKRIIRDVRNNKLNAPDGSALHLTAFHRDTDGNLFDLHLAAVELLNILRPTVAIAWYITFGATALHTYPSCRQKFLDNTDNFRSRFADEVRRFYPFAPFMGAIAKNDFQWNGYPFPKGALVLLDMYGTNHDPHIWDKPHEFNPDRFITHPIKPFDFLAQGGGDPHQGHRCPGEWITVETLKTFLAFMLEKMRFTVIGQDLSYNLSRMPTLPKSGFVMINVKVQ
ncbi:cytochrome P450 [Mucilaginibacter sp. Bleaf8]|uniref:cytochrome P450 n=1 Tax=Mucilaginibacter sp. Bleaf8 TaxID=2834430 RepID=UPI001BD0A954|nr:cytochrome P450 [Mucilaginibacter sp. Bleaf8]MBS7563900.1 cytochrome P450 [Mucilaginibacter sp. Bleaf8]